MNSRKIVVLKYHKSHEHVKNNNNLCSGSTFHNLLLRVKRSPHGAPLEARSTLRFIL